MRGVGPLCRVPCACPRQATAEYRSAMDKLTRGGSPPLGPQDHKLVLARLRSDKGCPKARERAITLLRAVAMLRAASPCPCYVGLTAMAGQRLRELSARVGGQGVPQGG